MNEMMGGVGFYGRIPASVERFCEWAAIFLVLTLGCFQAAGEDWPKFGHDLGNTGRSNETGINSKNVNTLETKWMFDSQSEFSTTPAVGTINGTAMVFIGAWDGTFYAFNATTGQKVWSSKVDAVDGKSCSGQVCRIGSSAAVDTTANMVFFGTASAYLYGLDAVTGKLVWKQSVGNSEKGHEVWSSPAVFQGMVYVGVASHGDDPCVDGDVRAYDELTGELVWKFDTLDQSTCPNGGTCVGGAVWSSVAVDETNGIIYAGTGNPGASCTPPTKNAGLYPDSILALNASTGTLLNYFQAVKNDTHDRDFGSSPILMSTGQTNQCTGQANTKYWITEGSKDGFVYFAERNANGLTGNVQKEPGGQFIATAAVRPKQKTTTCGSGQEIIDYTNTIYAPAQSAFWVYQQDHQGKASVVTDHGASKPLNGAPASIEDIVFFGASDGNLYVATADGKMLTKFKTGAIWGGIAISWGRVYFGTVDGKVYCMSLNRQ